MLKITCLGFGIIILLQTYIIIKLKEDYLKYRKFFYQFRAMFFNKILASSPSKNVIDTIDDCFNILDDNGDKIGYVNKIVNPDFKDRPELVIPMILSRIILLKSNITKSEVSKID